jgi:hypothetical protein
MENSNSLSKIVIFDLDETLGYFLELGIFWDSLKLYKKHKKNNAGEFTQLDFNEILDLYPEFVRPNIFPILKYLKRKTENGECNGVMIYTNNTGPKPWVLHIKDFFESNKIPILTVLVKKSAILSVGSFGFREAEDYALWLKLLKGGFKFASISLPLSFYRLHINSSSVSDRSISLGVICSIFDICNNDKLLFKFALKYKMKWKLHWVTNYCTVHNINQLKTTLIYANMYDIRHRILFSLQKHISFNLFKNILLRM